MHRSGASANGKWKRRGVSDGAAERDRGKGEGGADAARVEAERRLETESASGLAGGNIVLGMASYVSVLSSTL